MQLQRPWGPSSHHITQKGAAREVIDLQVQGGFAVCRMQRKSLSKTPSLWVCLYPRLPAQRSKHCRATRGIALSCVLHKLQVSWFIELLHVNKQLGFTPLPPSAVTWSSQDHSLFQGYTVIPLLLIGGDATLSAPSLLLQENSRMIPFCGKTEAVKSSIIKFCGTKSLYGGRRRGWLVLVCSVLASLAARCDLWRRSGMLTLMPGLHHGMPGINWAAPCRILNKQQRITKSKNQWKTLV